MKDYARSFYHSSAWKKTQKAYMQSQNYVCERCGGVAEIVHHKKYITPSNINNPSITLDWKNLECLCRRCHQHEHFQEKKVVADGLTFDDNGQLIKK